MKYSEIFDRKFWIQIIQILCCIITTCWLIYETKINSDWGIIFSMFGAGAAYCSFIMYDFVLGYIDNDEPIALIHIPECLWKGLKKFFGYDTLFVVSNDCEASIIESLLKEQSDYTKKRFQTEMKELLDINNE